MSVTIQPVAGSPVDRHTVAEFAGLSDSRGLELDGGVLSETSTGARAAWVAGRLFARVAEHVGRHGSGWAFPPGLPVACFPPQAARVRRPHVAFVRSGRIAGERLPTGPLTVVPDLVAEVVSPGDKAGALERKTTQFLAAGVRLLWVIYPRIGTASVRRPSGLGYAVLRDGFLDGEDVLPRFRLRLAELFPPDPPAPAVPAESGRQTP